MHMHMQQLDGVCDTTHLIFYVIVQYITKIGRISMNTTTNEEQLLKHLAVAIVEKPRSTIKELAESVEISKLLKPSSTDKPVISSLRLSIA